MTDKPNTTPEVPHAPSSLVNAIREAGTKDEACDYLQKKWNELCQTRARVSELEADNAILRTEKHADAEAIGAARDARADALREAINWHLDVAKHDAEGIEYSSLVGIPISNWKELDTSVKTHEWCARELEALIEGDTP